MLVMGSLSTINTIGFCLKNVIFGCVKTLSLIKNVFTYDNHSGFHELNSLLYKTDIKSKIAKIHSLLVDINENIPHENIKDSVRLSIKDLEDCIVKINTNIEDCIYCKQKHDMIYFSSLRKMDLTPQIKNLELHINILFNRFDDLVKILTVVKYIF